MKQLWKCCALVTMLVCLTAQGVERRSTVIIADLEHGVALVPDGVDLPTGIAVRGRDGKPLPFAHAPESEFTEARIRVAGTLSPDAPVPYRTFGVAKEPSTTGPNRFHAAVNDSDNTYYVTFYDGSYISARRIVIGTSQFGVTTGAYAAAGDYYSGTVYAEQASTDQPSYNASAFASINSSGGSVATNIIYIVTSDPYFSAHVVSSGNIHHHWLPICGRYGEPPCNENLSGSIDIYFP